jgi:putative oxidoreductase
MANPVSFQRWAGISLLGRVLLSAIFIISGISKIGNFGATRDAIVAHGVPVAGLFVVLSLVIEIAAGVCILIGLQGRISAMLLMAYLIPVTLIMHNFWSYMGPEHQMQLVNFLKNISIMGGLAQIAAMGPGPISVDQSRYHKGWTSDARDPSSRLRRVS